MSPELITGFQVATLTLTLTFLLEISCSIPEVFQLRSNPKGKRLYRACITANLVNNLLIGPPTYALATNFFVSRSVTPGEEYSAARSIASALGLIVAHALGYHYAHRQMHEPSMYWAHKFHHAFAKHVTPSSANAVSVVEYVYAYMLPFVAGCAVCAPDERALLAAVAVVSVNNLLIHTPRLEVISRFNPSAILIVLNRTYNVNQSIAQEISKMLPWWAVSTADHMMHHRVQASHRTLV